jgi:hypothetical protein
VPDPELWNLEPMCQRSGDGEYTALAQLLQQCTDVAYQLSDELSARFFAHSGEARYSVGA